MNAGRNCELCGESERRARGEHYAAFQISQRAASVIFFGGVERIENVSQFHPTHSTRLANRKARNISRESPEFEIMD